ncbi:MAG: threonylcarbamoyl-AMP synthase [Firmicutes bacterium]|nr:threonylcarbamoyl-AMP synthase [Bacillota bacterium]
METLVCRAEEPGVLERAGRLIREGSLVGFPTETVYGLGADALNGAACAAVFAAKGRPADNPLISHICSEQMGEMIAEFTPMAEKLAARFWPGPLTMVMPKRAVVPDTVTAGLDTVGVRWPVDKVAVAFIAAAGTPVAAPSANLSGRPSPTTAQHVYEDMAGKIPLILDGSSCSIGLESTVVDVRGKYPVLLRPGRITAEELQEICGGILFPSKKDASRPAAPGMKYRHYAPRGNVYLAEDGAEALLIADRLPALPLFLVSAETAETLTAHGVPAARVRVLFHRADPAPYARAVFAALRDADSDEEGEIVAEKVAETGLGLAIMNRLKKAAAK